TGLFVINHRISILEGFLENEGDGFLEADIQGLTNTLRFKHKVIVNLPGVDKPYGKEIRGCLIARDGYELCGSDMNSLEDMTKRHYIFPYDPDYVKEMSKPGYDPHLDLVKIAGTITQEQIDQHNLDKAAGKVSAIAHLRKPAKIVNYSSTYGIGAPKLARSMGVSVKEAKRLLDAFWKRNWAIEAFAKSLTVKTINDQSWLYNPVSKFWYTLRNEKDRFSTANQSTGVYCFDTWLGFILKQRPQLTAQFHDEAVWEIKKGHREDMEKIILSALDKTNNKLKLNVTLGVDIQFGQSYAEIH
ncbi:MAG: DNA polymerase, partial [Pseudomonadota bacterium]